MQVYRCDFCNKEFDIKRDIAKKYCYPDTTKPSKIVFYKRYIEDYDDVVSDVAFAYDICPECYEKMEANNGFNS